MNSTLTILKKLIDIPTVTGDHKANKQALDYIDNFLQTRGLVVERLTVNGFESLVATTAGTKTPDLLLAGHIDVVPAPEAMFALHEKDGKLYGRGTFDMKFAIATYLNIIDQLKGSIKEYSLGVMITTEEEFGGMNGTNVLVGRGYVPKVCILPDGGDDWHIETFAKSRWGGQIITYGKAAHGSRPWEGDNAIDKLMNLLAELKPLFGQQPTDNTMTISEITGGEAINQVPSFAQASLDLRLMGNDEYDRIYKAINAICSKYGATLTTEIYAQPCINSLDNPYIAEFVKLIEQHTGTRVEGTISYGATDGRYFSAVGVPCIIVRPPGGGHHGPDEWIDAASLPVFEAILREYITVITYTFFDHYQRP
jgi:acetylornithine deacetylase/succinyl-diaminopimelate desuccinylase-like protein